MTSNRHNGSEPMRMMTIRMPESLYAAVAEAAYRSRTSMNQYCVKILKGTEATNAARIEPAKADTQRRA